MGLDWDMFALDDEDTIEQEFLATIDDPQDSMGDSGRRIRDSMG